MVIGAGTLIIIAFALWACADNKADVSYENEQMTGQIDYKNSCLMYLLLAGALLLLLTVCGVIGPSQLALNGV